MVNEREEMLSLTSSSLLIHERCLRRGQYLGMPWFILRELPLLWQIFLGRRDSVGVIVYGDEVVSVDRDTGKKQLSMSF